MSESSHHAHSTLATARSLLFIPCGNHRFLRKAPTSGADAVVLDLEDAIPATEADRSAARLALPAAVAQLTAQGMAALVRINADPRWQQHDLHAAVAAGCTALVLPKVEEPAEVARLAGMAEWLAASSAAAGPVALVATIETPLGVLRCEAIAAAAPLLVALAFGADDFCGALGVDAASALLDHPAQRVALAARAHGLAAYGVPGTVTLLGQQLDADFARLVERARAMGFTGHLCIHPQQCEAVARCWRGPQDASARTWAQRVVAAAEHEAGQGRGAFRLDGRMVDEAVVRQARAVLAAAKQGEAP